MCSRRFLNMLVKLASCEKNGEKLLSYVGERNAPVVRAFLALRSSLSDWLAPFLLTHSINLLHMLCGCVYMCCTCLSATILMRLCVSVKFNNFLCVPTRKYKCSRDRGREKMRKRRWHTAASLFVIILSGPYWFPSLCLLNANNGPTPGQDPE